MFLGLLARCRLACIRDNLGCVTVYIKACVNLLNSSLIL